MSNQSNTDKEDTSGTARSTENESYIQRLFSDENARSTVDQIVKVLGDLAQTLPGQVGSALKLMREFVQEFTNVKGVRVQLESMLLLDFKIDTMKEADVPVRQKLPVGKLDAIHLGKRIHFQAGLAEGAKELHMTIKEGMTLVVDLGFLGKQRIPVKGSSKLTRDEKGELVIVMSSLATGADLPFTVSIPLRSIVNELRKQKG